MEVELTEITDTRIPQNDKGIDRFKKAEEIEAALDQAVTDYLKSRYPTLDSTRYFRRNSL